MGGSADASGAREVDPHVVAAVGQGRLAGVDPDPDLRRGVNESTLRLGGRGNGIARTAERDEERVALCVDLDAVVSSERVAQQPAMRGEQLLVCVAEPAREQGRPLDVGEEKSDGSGGKARQIPSRRA